MSLQLNFIYAVQLQLISCIC